MQDKSPPSSPLQGTMHTHAHSHSYSLHSQLTNLADFDNDKKPKNPQQAQENTENIQNLSSGSNWAPLGCKAITLPFTPHYITCLF